METLYFVLLTLSAMLATGLLLAPMVIFVRNVETVLSQDLGSAPIQVRRQLGRRCYFCLILGSVRYYYTPTAVANRMAAQIRMQYVQFQDS
ncbi:MAG TPA: hypothetical protein VM512_06485 [Burkholderiaceae bacterium]|jgi:hypothetical protein|nr:hypothetical protein [Burkholderiaceae bacterium]